MTKNLIITILIFITFIILLALIISNYFIRKMNKQPTIKELEKQYKNSKYE